LRLTVSQSVNLAVEPHLGLMTRYLLLFDSYGLVFVGRPLWREDPSLLYTCCWPLPAQSFSDPSPFGLLTIFYCLRFETSFFVASSDSQGHGGGIRPRLHTGNWLGCPISLIYNPFCTDRVGNTVSNSSSIVACLFLAAGSFLPSRCLEMDVVSDSFTSNGSFSGSAVLALSKYATICWILMIERFNN
jgi:hypothetical protein